MKRFSELVEEEGLLPYPHFQANTEGKKIRYSRILQGETNSLCDLEQTHHVKNGIDEKRLKKLKQESPADTIDLHGYTSSEAYQTLDLFLGTVLQQKRKLAKIIHGRGIHSNDGSAILRNKVRAWLRASHFVLAYVEQHKNPGATLVLLSERERNYEN